MKYVFIIGIARTASKTYQGIINKSSDIDIVNELHYLTPSWLKKDFQRHIKNKFGKDLTPDLVPHIVTEMFEGNLNGAFWSKTPNTNETNYNIRDIDSKKLNNHLANHTSLEDQSILKDILSEHAKSIGKRVGGAKFPVNIACAPTLVKWFPDAKFLHITRDPRAVYPSMVKMDLREIPKSTKVTQLKYNIFRFIYLIHQYRAALKFHKLMQNNSNYFLSTFEDLILNPKKQISEICTFLDIPFSMEMLGAQVIDTSFSSPSAKQQKGFNTHAIDRWRTNISPTTAALIAFLLKKEMRTFEYKK